TTEDVTRTSPTIPPASHPAHAWPSRGVPCFAPPVSNLTRAETRERAAQLTLHAVTVELDLRAARDPGTATFPTTTSLRLTSSAPTTWLDFLGPRVHGVDVDGQPRTVRFTGGRVHVDGLRTDGGESTVVVRGEGAYSRTG